MLGGGTGGFGGGGDEFRGGGGGGGGVFLDLTDAADFRGRRVILFGTKSFTVVTIYCVFY